MRSFLTFPRSFDHACLNFFHVDCRVVKQHCEAAVRGVMEMMVVVKARPMKWMQWSKMATVVVPVL